jgi:hypothetical protein
MWYLRAAWTAQELTDEALRRRYRRPARVSASTAGDDIAPSRSEGPGEGRRTLEGITDTERQPQIDGCGRVLALLEVDPITENDGAIEGEGGSEQYQATNSRIACS